MEPRIRTVKPELARHKGLFDLERLTGIPFRFIWAMFPCVCDREGRFRWRPWELKLFITPYDDTFDFSRVMDALATRGFLVKYACGTEVYGCIPTFRRHQVVNNREKSSELPSPEDQGATILKVAVDLPTRESRVNDATSTESRDCKEEGKGREGKGREDTTTTGLSGKTSPMNEKVRAAYAVWRDTLRTFEIEATPLNMVAEQSLARAINQLGFDDVLLALEGQRHEKANDKFDPAEHLAIDRVLHRDRFGVSRWEKFKNMALAHRAKVQAELKGDLSEVEAAERRLAEELGRV